MHFQAIALSTGPMTKEVFKRLMVEGKKRWNLDTMTR